MKKVQRANNQNSSSDEDEVDDFDIDMLVDVLQNQR